MARLRWRTIHARRIESTDGRFRIDRQGSLPSMTRYYLADAHEVNGRPRSFRLQREAKAEAAARAA